MRILTYGAVVMTALEFFFIFYLETIATVSGQTARVFDMTEEELQERPVQLLFRNQGIYNLVIGILLLVSLFGLQDEAAVMLFLVNILAVAAYGGISAHPMIFVKQGTLALIALVLLCFTGI